MIKVEKSSMKVEGTDEELCAELSMIIIKFLEKGVVNEEVLDIIVGLAKAEHNGNRKDYMKETLKNLINKKFEEIFKEDED